MRRKESTPKTPFAKTFRELEELRRQKDEEGRHNRISQIVSGNTEDVVHLLEAGDRAMHMRCIRRRYSENILAMTQEIRIAKTTRAQKEERQAAMQHYADTVRRADEVIAYLRSQGVGVEPRKKAM